MRTYFTAADRLSNDTFCSDFYLLCITSQHQTIQGRITKFRETNCPFQLHRCTVENIRKFSDRIWTWNHSFSRKVFKTFPVASKNFPVKKSPNFSYCVLFWCDDALLVREKKQKADRSTRLDPRLFLIEEGLNLHMFTRKLCSSVLLLPTVFASSKLCGFEIEQTWK